MIRRTEFEALKREVEAAKVKKGVGYKLRRTSGGTVLDILPGKGGATVSHPFKIIIEPKPGNEGDQPGDNGYRGYVTEGSLFNSLAPTDYLPITGLTMPTDTVPAYFDVLPTDAIYLETTYDATLTPTTTEVKTWGEGGTFDPSLDAWEEGAFVEITTGDVQTKSRIILGYTIPDQAGVPELTQSVKSNLLLRDCAIDGIAARYPVAHSGTYFLGGE